MTLPAIIVRSSDPNALLFWCVLGFCAGIGLFLYGFRLLQRRRLILDTPFSKIRSAAMGMIEVSGLAVGPYTMIAPITARPCYYFRTLIWEYKQSGKNKQWVKVAGECMHLPFFVDDNTGRLLVDPRGADLDLHRDYQEEFCDSFFTTKDPAPSNVRTFLARHGIVTNNKIKVEEYCIKPKNSLFILGTLTENPGLEVSPEPVHDDAIRSISASLSFGSMSIADISGERLDEASSTRRLAIPAPPREIVRLTPAESAPLKTSEMTQQQKIAAALAKAGIASPAAWAAAGVPTFDGAQGVQVLAEPAIASNEQDESAASGAEGFEQRPPVVLMKGTNDGTFLISWRCQQEVARSLGWKCVLMIWGGPALALLCLYVLLGMKNLL